MKGGNDTDRAQFPSHMNEIGYMLGSFDNFDHDDGSSLSGTKSNHDTVTVVYQERKVGDQISRKPKISECENLKPCVNVVEKLPCQKLASFSRPSNFKNLPLPQSLNTNLPDPIYEKNCHCILFQLFNEAIEIQQTSVYCFMFCYWMW